MFSKFFSKKPHDTASESQGGHAATNRVEGAQMSLESKIEKMDYVEGLPRGQHTRFYFQGLKDPVQFASGLLARLNQISEPDYPLFGIVGFGLIARVVADYPNQLHIDVQLSSTKCVHETALADSIGDAVRDFLVEAGLPEWRNAVTLNLLSPENAEIRGGPWGPGIMDQDVRAAFDALSKQYVVLAAAGYLTQGSMPDSVFTQGAQLFQAFDGREGLNEIISAANTIVAGLAARIPQFAEVDFTTLAARNQEVMRGLELGSEAE